MGVYVAYCLDLSNIAQFLYFFTNVLPRIVYKKPFGQVNVRASFSISILTFSQIQNFFQILYTNIRPNICGNVLSLTIMLQKAFKFRWWWFFRRTYFWTKIRLFSETWVIIKDVKSKSKIFRQSWKFTKFALNLIQHKQNKIWYPIKETLCTSCITMYHMT